MSFGCARASDKERRNAAAGCCAANANFRARGMCLTILCNINSAVYCFGTQCGCCCGTKVLIRVRAQSICRNVARNVVR